jgi:hypothetical protein
MGSNCPGCLYRIRRRLTQCSSQSWPSHSSRVCGTRCLQTPTWPRPQGARSPQRPRQHCGSRLGRSSQTGHLSRETAPRKPIRTRTTVVTTSGASHGAPIPAASGGPGESLTRGSTHREQQSSTARAAANGPFASSPSPRPTKHLTPQSAIRMTDSDDLVTRARPPGSARSPPSGANCLAPG